MKFRELETVVLERDIPERGFLAVEVFRERGDHDRRH